MIKKQCFVLFVLTPWLCFMAQARLVVALGSAPNNLDPYYATDANSQDLNRLLHLSLVDANAQMETVCRACEKFEEKISADGTHTVTFWLRQDLKFHDGSKVNASDVVTSVNRLLANKTAPIPALFKELKTTKEIDSKTVSLIFTAYRPENLTNLALLKIEKFAGDQRLGAGLYRLIEKSSVHVLINGPYEIEFKFIADETTMALKLINGEIDVIATSISPRKIEWMNKQPQLRLFETQGTNYVYIAPSHRHEDLKNWRVRKAISHLIPREELAKYKQKNTVTLAEGMFSPAFEKLYLGSGAVAYDEEKAMQFLTQAGYKFVDGRWFKNNRKLSFTLKVSNKKHIIELANALIPYFLKAGIELRVQSAEWGTFYRDLKAGNFDLALGQWVGFTGPDQMGFTFLESSIPPGGANRGFYTDSEFEKLYSLAVNQTDDKLRYKYYRLAYERVVKDEAYISLWHPKIIWATRDCVKKLVPYPSGNFLAFESLEHQCQH